MEKKEEVLQVLELHEWVRARPDTFVGAVDPEPQLRWIVGKRSEVAALTPSISTAADPKTKRMKAKQVKLAGGGGASSCLDAMSVASTTSVKSEGSVAAESETLDQVSVAASSTPGVSTGKLSLKDCGAAYLLVEVSPASEKIVDEILQNALDRQHKDPSMTKIEVTVDAASGVVTVRNNGAGMSVTKPERTRPDIPDEYWPTILCTRSMTGGNFSSDTAHFQGGRNGIGMKATSILSTWFKIEVGDPANKKHFVQEWRNGLKETTGPIVKSHKAKGGFVEVSFQPDMPYFKQAGTGFSSEFAALIRSRVWELTAVADSHIGIWLDGERLPVKSLAQFTSLFTPHAARPIKASYTANGRTLWDLTIVPLQPGMAAGVVAFVNGIRCCEGKHVTFLMSRLAEILQPAVAAKTKQATVDVTEAQVKKNMFVVLSMWADGPRFKSQNKDTLDSPAKDWGFKWIPDDDFRKKIISAFADVVSSKMKMDAEEGAMKESAKATGGRRSVNLPKYEPAGDAGKPNTEASLILTEGDSAKGLAMAGRAQTGSKVIGVYPLKGVPLNCRGMDTKSIVENEILSNVAKILGLEYGRVFEDAADLKRLNYKYLVLLADQDFDGGHIVGLVVNWVQYCWPSLLALRPDFIRRFATPLIIADRKKSVKTGTPQVKFLSIPAFKRWLIEDIGRKTAYDFSYYKGLGGHSSKQGREYFKAYADYTVTIMYDAERDSETLENFFNDKRANTRKQLITEYSEDAALDYSKESVTVTDFLMTETLGFCNDNVPRGIPGVDGCKRTQRKLLWACRELLPAGKVSKLTDLAMKCGEKSKYHHGEVSLYGTMVSMAQAHPGSNNVNYFICESQMGDRHNNRGTFTAPRYLSTGPEHILSYLIRKEDDPILTYRIEDGKHVVEPTNFFPVVPLDILNGVIGVTSGWSTKIPAFHPVDIIHAFRACLQEEPDWHTAADALLPWFDGLTGPILDQGKSWLSIGLYAVHKMSDTVTNIVLLDLPFGVWTHEYQEKTLAKYLIRREGSETTGFIARVESDATDTRIQYTLVCETDLLEKALKGTVDSKRGDLFPRDYRLPLNTADASIARQVDAFYEACPHRYPKLEELLALTVTINKTNMFRLDPASHPRHFKSLSDIVAMYVDIRLDAYRERLDFQIADVRRQLLKAQNKLRYITEIVAQTFKPNEYEETADMWAELHRRGYLCDEDPAIRKAAVKTVSDLPIGTLALTNGEVLTFHYLTDLGDGSKTKGACRRQQDEIIKLHADMAKLAEVTPHATWLAELQELKEAYDAFSLKRREANRIDKDTAAASTSGKRKLAMPTKKSAKK
jgi:DNA topoisomerase-2